MPTSTRTQPSLIRIVLVLTGQLIAKGCESVTRILNGDACEPKPIVPHKPSRVRWVAHRKVDLEFREGLLDRPEIGSIGRQKDQRTSRLNQILRPSNLVNAQGNPDHDIPREQHQNQDGSTPVLSAQR